MDEHNKRHLKTAQNLGLSLKKVSVTEWRRGVRSSGHLYRNGVLIAHLEDDGISAIEIDSVANKNGSRSTATIRQLRDEIQVIQTEEEKNGITASESVDITYLFHALITAFEDKMEFNRNKKKGVLYANGTRVMGWKLTIPSMIKRYGADKVLGDLQRFYDKLVADGETVDNADYLASVGVKV